MAEPYVGEIRCFGFNFAPTNWAFCNGQLLSINQNPALFAILGVTYGGNGTSTFGLPNLQGLIPMHWGSTPSGGAPTTMLGEIQGTNQVTLTTPNLPPHQHQIFAATPGSAGEKSPTPTATSYLSDAKGGFIYQNPPASPNAVFSPKAIGLTGSGQQHDNMQPYLALNFCISLYGVFPPHS